MTAHDDGWATAARCPHDRRPRPCARRTASTRRRWSAIWPRTCRARCRSRAVSQFAAGQSNPTYLIEGPERRFVLRKKPPGTLLPSAHLVGARVPHPRRPRRDRRARAAGASPVRGHRRHRHGLLRHGPRRRRGRPGPGVARARAGRAGRGLPLDGGRAGAAAPGRLARALGLADFGREGNYIAAPDPPLERPVRRLAHRRDTRDGPPAGVAARPHPGRRRDHHRPRRLPAGEPHRARRRAAHRRRARLGAEHFGSSAERPRPQLPGLLDPPWRLGPAGAGRRGFWGARAAGGGGAPGRLLRARRAAARSPNGASTWPSPSSAWRRSARACTRAASRAMPARPTRTSTATGRGSSPSWGGRRRRGQATFGRRLRERGIRGGPLSRPVASPSKTDSLPATHAKGNARGQTP